jgi:hypothetical protein
MAATVECLEGDDSARIVKTSDDFEIAGGHLDAAKIVREEMPPFPKKVHYCWPALAPPCRIHGPWDIRGRRLHTVHTAIHAMPVTLKTKISSMCR